MQSNLFGGREGREGEWPPGRDTEGHGGGSPADGPLAARMRPRTLDEFIGQRHIVGPGRLLRRAIQVDRLSSLIFSGPPGTGKTTLARIIANTTKSNFLAINAVLAGVKDIREAIEQARRARETDGRRTILFVDEVHRFNKAQQDALLPHVENGTLILIGATTENPYFEVNKALVSRSRIFQLRPLAPEDVREALVRVLRDPERGYGRLQVRLDEEALEHLVRVSAGDARSALNALELAVETTRPAGDGIVHVGLAEAEESIQRRAVLYDKDGDAHYDTISAFIKSVRGSDPDAALYWMAKMIYAGEDPRFIFRRMLILAGEDVGLADPRALGVVQAAAQAFDYVGLPEGQFHLAQACLYLATAPKSNSTLAYFDVLRSVERERDDEVPDHLKDSSRDAEGFGHGQGYRYPHAYREHWVAQQYLPDSLQGRVFYQPSDSGYEAGIREEVQRRREAHKAAGEGLGDSMAEGIPSGKASVAKASNPWLERALGASGEILKAARDGLFDLAGPRREDLVLDISGTGGFLTWEALRRCPEGGVWTRCRDEKDRAAIADWAARLGPLGEPVLFVSGLEDLPRVLESGPDSPLFDAVLGWNLLAPLPQVEAFLDGLEPFLSPSAVITLAEIDRGRSTLLSELLPPEELGPDLHRSLTDMENSLSREVGGGGEALRAAAIARGFALQTSIREFRGSRRFPRSRVKSWFDAAPAQSGEAEKDPRFSEDSRSSAAGPPSLFHRMNAALTQEERELLRSGCLRVLADRELPWRQAYRFHRLSRGEQADLPRVG